MNLHPEEEARIKRVGLAALDMIEAMRGIGEKHGLSGPEAVVAVEVAADMIERAGFVVKTILDIGSGGDG